MKVNILHLKASVTVILLLVVQTGLYSCPKCNQTFYDELLGPRANTLGGQELLQAIRNQSVSGQTSGFDPLPVNNILADNQRSDNQVKSENNEMPGNENDRQTGTPLLSFIRFVAQLIFFGRLVT